MAWSAGAYGPHRCLVGVRLEPGDQFLEVIRRYRLLCHEQQRSIREQRDRREIVHDVVLKGIGNGVPDVSVPDAEDQSIPVGRGAGDSTGTDAAVRATDILDDNGLTERARMPSAAMRPPSCLGDPHVGDLDRLAAAFPRGLRFSFLKWLAAPKSEAHWTVFRRS